MIRLWTSLDYAAPGTSWLIAQPMCFSPIRTSQQTGLVEAAPDDGASPIQKLGRILTISSQAIMVPHAESTNTE